MFCSTFTLATPWAWALCPTDIFSWIFNTHRSRTDYSKIAARVIDIAANMVYVSDNLKEFQIPLRNCPEAGIPPLSTQMYVYIIGPEKGMEATKR